MNFQDSGLDGKDVKAGQILGYYAREPKDALCEGGTSTGAHCHFTLLRDGRPVSLHYKKLSGYQVVAGSRNYDHDCNIAHLMKNGKKICPHEKVLNDVRFASR